jgi:hypothetical protein
MGNRPEGVIRKVEEEEEEEEKGTKCIMRRFIIYSLHQILLGARGSVVG